MVFLRMVRLVEDEEVDLINRNECMHKALIQDVGSTNNDHVVSEVPSPFAFVPEIAPHLAAETINLLVKVAF